MAHPRTTKGTNRRGFLRWTGRVGITSVGVLAGLTAVQPAAHACIAHACCCLIKPSGGCPGSGSGFTCPSGYTKRIWGCCQGGRDWGCGECTTASTCWGATTANTACSEHWSIGQTGCG